MPASSRYYRKRIHSESDALFEPETSQPLIEKVTNAWQADENFAYEHDEDRYPTLRNLESVSPRRAFRRIWHRTKWSRRILLALVTLYLLCSQIYHHRVLPWVQEDRLFRPGLDKSFAGYGVQVPQHHDHVVRIAHLAEEHLPSGPADSKGKKRLIFVGDIHGCLAELNALLKAVRFNAAFDHLIHTGDVVAKGPDSAGVIDRLMALNASGVRGNWEDHYLTSTKTAFHPSKLRMINKPKYNPDTDTVITGNDLSPSQIPRPGPQSSSSQHADVISLRRSLKAHHHRYLASLPLILSVPPLHAHRPLFPQKLPKHPLRNITISPHHQSLPPLPPSELLVVHAGLVPAVPLSRQDPTTLTTMRYISPKSHLPSAHKRPHFVPWPRAWNWYQNRLERGVRLPRVAALDKGDTVRPATDHETYQLWPSGPESKFRGDFRDLIETIQGLGWGRVAETVARWGGFEDESARRIWSQKDKGREERERGDWEVQRREERPSGVVYGHNRAGGVSLDKWTTGLDGGCVGGGRLVALVVGKGGRRELVSVSCRNYLL
ncbi:hypothetical protein CAC42_8245 [Sphaceloma murrayae]|uniref:Calcineurin-like phosphoesterase domain-containing protein n=1 Tax=Sphaceloma murrayae TaxID=2082308 RepID=A0A2K1QJ98_9PEZI|nr:hypothetical protein CAC42_8245 [Sphaceloma murrayae]